MYGDYSNRAVYRATNSISPNIAGIDELVFMPTELSLDVRQEVSDLYSDEGSYDANANNVENSNEKQVENTYEQQALVLPPQKNRGVPPYHYRPKHMSQNSIYPVNAVKGELQKVHVSFQQLSLRIHSQNSARRK